MFEISAPTKHSIKQQTQEQQQEDVDSEAVETFLELEDNHTIDFLVENYKELEICMDGFLFVIITTIFFIYLP